MTVFVGILAVAAIALAVENAVIIRLLTRRGAAPPETESREDGFAKRRAAELQQAWNDGVSSIVGYDIMTARRAARDEDGD